MALRIEQWFLALALCAAPSARAGAPLKLDIAASVERAREHDRALRDRYDEVAAAGHRVASSRARFFPQLRASARYARLSYVAPAELQIPLSIPGQPPPEPITLGEAIENQYGLRFSVEQPVFSGFSLLQGMNASRSGEALARARAQAQEVELRVAVEEAYLGLLQARELERVARDSVQVVERHAESVANLRAQGQATAWEQDRVASRLAGARAQLLHAQSAARLATLSLLTLLGLPDDQELELSESLEAPPVSDAAPTEELVAQAMSRRTELEVARASAEVRRAQARAAYAPMWPQVRIAASYGWERPNTRYFPPENVTRSSWDAGATLQWTLFDWGATWHAAKALSFEADVAERAVAELEDKVRLDVERRQGDARAVHASVEAAAREVAASQSALERAKSLCAAGQATCGAVLDAELDLTRARAERTRSLANARLALLQLRRATGGLNP